jgi:hypothetical protein
MVGMAAGGEKLTELMIVTMRLTKTSTDNNFMLRCCDGNETELVDGNEPMYDENGDLEPFVKDFYMCDKCNYCVRQSEIEKIVKQMHSGETVFVTAKTWFDLFTGTM